MDKVAQMQQKRPWPRGEQTSDESENHIFDETDYQIYNETMFWMKEGSGLRAQTHKFEQDSPVLKVIWYPLIQEGNHGNSGKAALGR